MMAEIPNGTPPSTASPFVSRSNNNDNNATDMPPFATMLMQKPTSKAGGTISRCCEDPPRNNNCSNNRNSGARDDDVNCGNAFFIKRSTRMEETHHHRYHRSGGGCSLKHGVESGEGSGISNTRMDRTIHDCQDGNHSSDDSVCNNNNDHNDSYEEEPTALHESFDSSLLMGESITDFDNKNNQDDGDGDVSGRKHYLRPRTEAERTQEMHPPCTVRKKQARARRVTAGTITKTPGRPGRTKHNGSTTSLTINSPTATSSAVKRRLEPLSHPARQSPMRRVPPASSWGNSNRAPPMHLWSPTTTGQQSTPRRPPSSPLTSTDTNLYVSDINNAGVFGRNSAQQDQMVPTMTPTRQRNPDIGPFGTVVKKLPYFSGTTAGTTLLETTFETDAGDSVDTSSPARFRFTSFPASLPRVNNPRSIPRTCPGSVRKRMSFEENDCLEENEPGVGGINAAIHYSGNHGGSNELNQSRDDDGTQNTSISSLSAEGGHHHHLPHLPNQHPPHMAVPHERLLFPEESSDAYQHNNLLFGYSDDEDEFDGVTDDPLRRRAAAGRTRLDFNVLLSPSKKEHEDDEGGKMLRPLDLNLELSRPYDQRRVNSFPSSLSSNTHMNISSCEDLGTSTPPREALNGRESRPETPREVQLHFPLESECSPIPDVKDDIVNGPLVRQESSSHASSPLIGDKLISSKGPFGSISSSFAHDSRQASRKSGGSSSSASDSTSTQKRSLRPMPDMSAFENVASSSRSVDDSTGADSRGTHRRLCPPTPQRTPAWANEGSNHAYFSRQNSLNTTKVLLSCPSQVLEGRCSLESSVLEDDNSKSSCIRRRSFPHNRDSIGSLVFGGPTNPSATPSKDRSTDMYIEKSGSSPSPHKPNDIDPNAHTPRVQITAPPRLMRRLPSASEATGSVISFTTDFEVLSVLGSGAFADVYKVRSTRDNQLYAVKRNRRQFRGKRDRDMALAEVQSMQSLQSVFAEAASDKTSHGLTSEKYSYSLYLLFFYRAWQEDGYFYCQTELCCRDTCREMLDSLRFAWNSAKSKYPSLLRNLPAPAGVVSGSDQDHAGRLVPQTTVWKICHDIVAGLSHIHSHGIVHQDIKPSNIFFVSNPRFGAMCKIGDFGMAGSIGSSGDGQEGDTKYMPPELLVSSTRHASSDIFSLGLTLFEIATDEHLEMPSEGPRWHQLRSNDQPKVPACRGHELERLIQLMTNPDETKRPNADEILAYDLVKAAGQGVDKFLHEYINDVEEFDRQEEERRAVRQAEDQTPRHDHHRSGVVRSPTLSMLLPNPPNLMSPPLGHMHA